MLRLLTALVAAALLAALYFFIALNWSYSTGERAGWVQKLSKKGWICKTWEGELALVSLPGTTVEKFLFTVRDEEVAQKLMREMGKRVSLHYEEKVGLPTTCFGDTRYFITGVVQAQDIPLGPGVTLPAQGDSVAAPPKPAAPVPTPATSVAPAPAPVASAASAP